MDQHIVEVLPPEIRKQVIPSLAAAGLDASQEGAAALYALRFRQGDQAKRAEQIGCDRAPWVAEDQPFAEERPKPIDVRFHRRPWQRLRRKLHLINIALVVSPLGPARPHIAGERDHRTSGRGLKLLCRE